MIEGLLFKRENFPIDRDFRRCSFSLPPYHPSMMKQGIDTYLMPPVLDEAVLATIQDFTGIGEMKHVEFLRSIAEWNVIEKDDGLLIAPFPISFGQLFVQSRKISPYGGDHYIEIDNERNLGLVTIEGDVSEEIKQVYELSRERILPSEKKMFTCPYRWNYHNVFPTDRVLYKNLIISLDNAAVKGNQTGYQ
jgi:hypothetical protein